MAIYVEWNFLKPNWYENSIECASRNFMSRLYITFSKTFDKEHSKETGL